MNNNETKKHLQEMAGKLSRALSGEASPKKTDVISEILITLANESGFGVDDPRIIQYSFPVMMEAVSIDYSRGIFHSLDAILETETFDQNENTAVNNSENKPPESNRPLEIKETIITEDEAKILVESLLAESGYENYAIEGFIFMFQSFAQFARKDKLGLEDFCNELSAFVYSHSLHNSTIGRKYVESAHKRYRETNWHYETSNFVENLENEIRGNDESSQIETPEGADKSETGLSELAAQISEVMKNPLFPKHLYNILSDELSEVPDQADSPEWILTNLTKLQAENNEI